MVSAFTTGARLVLAQQKVAEKSNEMTAIPLLLKWLSLKDNIITIDAMGTQKVIAKQIHKGAFKGVGLKALRKKAGWDNDRPNLVVKSLN